MKVLLLGILRLLIILALIGGLVLFAPSGWTGFFLGMFLGIFGVIIVACMRGDRKYCLYCGEAMKGWATVCPHCQRTITGQRA